MNASAPSTADAAAQPSRHSGVGIASFVLGLISLPGLILALAIMVTAMLASGGHLDEHSGTAVGAGLLLVLAGLLALIGAGLGVAGVMQRARRRIFAILGLCFNSPVVLLILTFLIIGLAKK